MRTRLAAAAIVLATSLALAGCESTAVIPTPAPSDVSGTWSHGNTTLELDEDGSFALHEIPTGVVEQSGVAAGASPKGPQVDVDGTWHLGSGGNDAGGAPGVQLDFANPRTVGPNTGLTLLVSSGSPRHLFVYLGHPEARHEYEFTRRG